MLASFVSFIGACAADATSPDEEPVAAVPDREPTAAAPLDVIAQVAGHFDGHSLSFAPVKDDGTFHTQNYGEYGRVGLDFSETGTLVFKTVEAIVTNNKDASCTASAKKYPTNTFADGKDHTLSDGSVCKNGHLCAIVTISNKGTSFLDRLYTEVSAFKPSGFKGDNGLQPYSAANTSGYPAGFGLSGTTGLWSHGSVAPAGTTTKVRWDFALPTCQDFNFLTTVKASKRVTRYGVTSLTQPFQDACVMSGTSGNLFTSTGDTKDVQAPFPITIYDKPIASLAITKYGFLHEGKERTSLSTDLTSALNTDFPLNTSLAWALVPYWTSAIPTSVCTATTGGTPNRSFVVTWKYNSPVDSYVSAVVHETTDVVEFQYAGAARCGVTNTYRGGLGTVGIQGNGSTYKRANYNNGAFLSSTACQTTPAGGPNGMQVPTIRMSPNTGASPPNDPFSAGNSNTSLSFVVAGDYLYENSDQKICVNLTVTGTTSTRTAWEVRVDLSLPPFNGLTWDKLDGAQGYNQVVVSDAGGGFARITGKASKKSTDAWDAGYNNALISSSDVLNRIKLCSYQTPPAITGNTDSSWYTLTYTQGTGANWSDTLACVTVTATAVVDPTYFPFDFAWQATLDMRAAKARVKNLNYVSWSPHAQGSGYWTSTPGDPYKPPADSYAIVSGASGGNDGNLNILNYKTQTLTACVHSN